MVPLVGLEELTIDWPDFVETRMAARVEQLRHSTLGAEWPLAATRLFESQITSLKEPFDPVLLCADLTDEHVMLCRRDREWRFSGVIDFGDAMVGHPLYEFAAPACSITHDDPALLTELLLAYGFTGADLTEALTERLLAYTLLHRYIDIQELVAMLGTDRVDTLDRLRESLWSFA